MRQLILLIIPVLQRNVNTQIMSTRSHSNTRASKFCAQLIVSSSVNSLFGTVNVECGNWRVMGGLFGEVGDFNGLGVAGYAGGTARGCGVGGMFESRLSIFDGPITLAKSMTLSLLEDEFGLL